MPGVGAGPSVAQQVERAVQPRLQVDEGERGQPARGQLDGKRHAVELSNDVGDGPELVRRHPVPWPHPRGAVEEDCDRGDVREVALVGGVGQRERGQPERVLGGQPERFAARGQHGHPGARGQDRADRVADRAEEVLAVVDDQEPGLVAEHGEAGGQDVALHDVQVQGRRQRVGYRGGVGDGCEQQHPGRLAGTGDVQGDPRLAHAARPDERDQPLHREQPVQHCDLGLATDQPGGWPDRPDGCDRDRVGRAGGDVAFQLQQAPVTGPTRSPRRAACGTYARSGAPRVRGPWLPACASGAGRQVRAAGRRRACRRPGRPPWRPRPRRSAQPISASVTSRWSCAHPSTAVAIASTSVRSARTGPRHSAFASRSSGNAPAGSRCARVRAVASRARACVTSRSAGSRSRRYPSCRVCRRAAALPRCRTEPGHVGVQGLARRVGHLGRPQRVHETVDGYRPSLGERQQREHGPPFGPGHLDRHAVDDQPQGSEHLHPHPRGLVDCTHPVHPLPDRWCQRGESACKIVDTLAVDPGCHHPARAGRTNREKKDGSHQARRVPRPLRRRPGRGRRRRADGHRQPTRPLHLARGGSGDCRAVRRTHRLPHSLPDRMAAGSGRGRLRGLRRGDRPVLADGRAGVLPGGPERAEPVGLGPHRAGLPARGAEADRSVPDGRRNRLARARRGRVRRLRRVLPARLRGRAGSAPGSRRWPRWRRSSAPAGGSPTSGAASGPAPC